MNIKNRLLCLLISIINFYLLGMKEESKPQQLPTFSIREAEKYIRKNFTGAEESYFAVQPQLFLSRPASFRTSTFSPRSIKTDNHVTIVKK